METLIDEAFGVGVAEISNENSPTQFVVSGERAAVARVADLFASQEFAEPVVIEKRIPMHSSVFRSVAVRFEPHLAAVPWSTPASSYFPNVLGCPLERAKPSEFAAHLAAHVHRPVLWRQSIDWIVARHPDAVFIEVGPRRVLCNLLSRKWVCNRRLATDDAAFDAVAAEVGKLTVEDT